MGWGNHSLLAGCAVLWAGSSSGAVAPPLWNHLIPLSLCRLGFVPAVISQWDHQGQAQPVIMFSKKLITHYIIIKKAVSQQKYFVICHAFFFTIFVGTGWTIPLWQQGLNQVIMGKPKSWLCALQVFASFSTSFLPRSWGRSHLFHTLWKPRKVFHSGRSGSTCAVLVVQELKQDWHRSCVHSLTCGI